MLVRGILVPRARDPFGLRQISSTQPRSHFLDDPYAEGKMSPGNEVVVPRARITLIQQNGNWCAGVNFIENVIIPFSLQFKHPFTKENRHGSYAQPENKALPPVFNIFIETVFKLLRQEQVLGRDRKKWITMRKRIKKLENK